MQLSVRGDAGDRDVTVHAVDGATIGDLAEAIASSVPLDHLTVVVDGCPVPSDTPLCDAGLVAGSVVALVAGAGPGSSSTARSDCRVELHILSGPGAGMSVPLASGRHVIGTGPGADVVLRAPGVAPRHAVIDVALGEAVRVWAPPFGPAHQITSETTIRIGGCLVAIVPAPRRRQAAALPAGRRGTARFNRPPRRREEPTDVVLSVPPAPRPPARRPRSGVAVLVVPVMFGIVMAVAVHPRMALFALLGPLMAVAGLLDERRRLLRFRRESASEIAHAGLRVAADLDLARLGEIRRRHRNRPSVATLRQRAVVGSPRLWERRPGDDDFLCLVLGYGRQRWRPAFDGDVEAAPAPVRRILDRRRHLPRGPVIIDLRPGSVIGIAGDRGQALDLARGLVCQATALHGPADLRVAVVTDDPNDWDWVKWLPHTLADVASRQRLLAVGADETTRLAASLSAPVKSPVSPPWPGAFHPTPPHTAQNGPVTLVVVDVATASMTQAPIRHLLGGRVGPAAGIVVGSDRDRLPAACTAVAVVGDEGAPLSLVGGLGTGVELAPAGATPEVARRVAMALTRFDDPEREDDGAELPETVRLLDLLDLREPDPAAVARRWAAGGGLRTPIGVTEHGTLVLDVVADGPHGLVAGTTGSGKSELLRSLVAGLAVGSSPNELTFVLVDYKGGSAFDACARLPHAVGLVTDLDDRLAQRALVCLEAELRYREECLRSVGAEDVAGYRLVEGGPPLPRMLVVIDEFAALAKELPEFMDALVDIGARGRSLGLHLLLATQRPAGVVREHLRANTNLRIALRVNDRTDAIDVVDDARPAAIGRTQPGRGYVRLGPSELLAFQAATVTATVGASTAPVRVDPFPFAAELPEAAVVDDHVGATDLERLVAAIVEAAAITGVPAPRRPWPDPLPEVVSVDELDLAGAPAETAVPLGLVDEPDRQRRRTLWWDPEQGPLLVYGMSGAGTTTTLGTIAVGLAASAGPDDLHVYVLDFDGGGLSAVGELPHVGAVIGPGERERQVRLLRTLAEEVERRRGASDAGRPRIALLVDGFGAFEAAFADLADAPTREALQLIVTSGAAVGVVAVVTATRANAIPTTIASTVGNKLVLRLADPLAATTFGLRRLPVDLPPGRAVQVGTGGEIQLAVPDRDGLQVAVRRVAARWAESGLPPPDHRRRHRRPPPPVRDLPRVVAIDELVDAVRLDGEQWMLPIGIGDRRLEPVGFRLGSGDHVLMVGEPHSGRSTLLVAIAVLARRCLPELELMALAPRRSPLCDRAELALVAPDVDTLAAALSTTGEGVRRLVLIDDVDDLDVDPRLTALISKRDPGLHVIAAGRRDLRSRYQHWAKELCRSRVGLWLRPTPGVDADLWSTPLPRTVPGGMPAGRGYLVADGAVELVQVMTP